MSDSTQDARSIETNREYFADNDWYKKTQAELELYRFIALSAAHETASARRLLDIGNGGVFIFPIAHIPEVEAIDLFIESTFAARYPSVKWSQMSAMELRFDRPFDTVVSINTLHHIVGDGVLATYQNLTRVFEQVAGVMEPGGKFVLLESTVPAWFLSLYKIAFPLLVKLWPLDHPPTFQFHFRDLLAAAEHVGLKLEEFCWIPKTSDVLSLGFQIKPWMTPIRMGKFVFRKA